MHASRALAIVGPDRPGIVNQLSDVARRFGANWAGSRMASLAGQFAGMVHFEVSDRDADALASALEELTASGLHVVIVACDDKGNIDVDDLRAKVAEESELGEKEVRAAEETAGKNGGRLSSSYFLGLVLTLSNPATIGFWCAVSLTAAGRLQGTLARTRACFAGTSRAAG